MDIFFQDPSEVPLPPEQVRIRELKAEPWPDGRRVRIYLEVDPFQKRPSADVVILNQFDGLLAEVSVVESMTRIMEFNMHLRGGEPSAHCRVLATLYYQMLPETESNRQTAGPEDLPEIQRQIVDHGETGFDLPGTL